MKQDTLLILKLLLTFLKELVVGKRSFSAKCPLLNINILYYAAFGQYENGLELRVDWLQSETYM